jgi:hypothetical protein
MAYLISQPIYDYSKTFVPGTVGGKARNYIAQAIHGNLEIDLEEAEQNPLVGDYAWYAKGDTVWQRRPADQPPVSRKGFEKHLRWLEQGNRRMATYHLKPQRFQQDTYDYSTGPKQFAVCANETAAQYIALVLNLEWDHC